MDSSTPGGAFACRRHAQPWKCARWVRMKRRCRRACGARASTLQIRAAGALRLWLTRSWAGCSKRFSGGGHQRVGLESSAFTAGKPDGQSAWRQTRARQIAGSI